MFRRQCRQAGANGRYLGTARQRFDSDLKTQGLRQGQPCVLGHKSLRRVCPRELCAASAGVLFHPTLKILADAGIEAIAST